MAPKPRKLFINLPVASLAPSTAFYQSLGFTFNAAWSCKDSASLKITDDLHVMIHEHSRYSSWVAKGKAIADAAKTSEVILSFSAQSKEDVDEWIEKVTQAGGKVDPYTVTEGAEFGMYCRSFEDLDGHTWEVVYMPLDGCSEATKKAEEEKKDA